MYKIAPWFKVFPVEIGGYIGVGHSQQFLGNQDTWNKTLDLVRFLMTPRTEDHIDKYVKEQCALEEMQILKRMDSIVNEEYFDANDSIPEYLQRNKHYWHLTYQDDGSIGRMLSHTKIALVGCGGLGSNCALLLCAAGIGSLHVIDPDLVESSNLNRQFTYSMQDIGQPKVKVLERFLRARFVNTEVRANQLDITVKLDALLGCDLVLCCADEPDDLPNIVQKHCAENGLAYLNAGYIGNYAVVGPLVKTGDNQSTEKMLQLTGAAGNLSMVNDINSCSKPASYPTLNYLSSAIAVEEITKYIIGRNDLLATQNARLGVELRSMTINRITI